MSYSKYQIDIFDFIKNIMGGNGVIEAVAGSGKTTTIVKCLDFLPDIAYNRYNPDIMMMDEGFGRPKVLFVAFNAHIAAELKKRVPSNVTASTLNSAGWSICMKNVRNVKLDIKKDENLLKEIINTTTEEGRKLYYAIKNQVCKMVSLIKALGGNCDNLNAIANKYEIEIPQNDGIEFFEIVEELFKLSASTLDRMNFDDQIFMPIWNDWAFPEYDWVFGDEAQDWSPIQIEFVCRMGKHGRVVAVGDRRQSIYGFRGADPEAIPNIIRSLAAIVLPLSICYRCPDKVIAEARKIVSHIESPPNNPKGDGIVETVTTEYFVENAQDGDYVLCRLTAPLVKRCLQQIRKGQKATVKGRDIGKGLQALINTIANNSTCPISVFIDALRKYRQEQVEKLKKLERESEANSLEDKCDTLEVLVLDCRTTQDIHDRINKIFSDDTDGGIVFSTGHRAKGLEADRVWLLRYDLCPLPRAKGEWQIVQEMNLLYVIRTRAMKEFYYVTKEDGEK